MWRTRYYWTSRASASFALCSAISCISVRCGKSPQLTGEQQERLASLVIRPAERPSPAPARKGPGDRGWCPWPSSETYPPSPSTSPAKATTGFRAGTQKRSSWKVGRCGCCLRPGASQCPTGLKCGYGHWRTSSPTSRPRTSSFGSTAPGPRSDARGRADPGGGPSSRASADRTRSRPPRSATGRAACCCPGWSGPAGCTTRRPCAPRASPNSSDSTPR